MTNVEYEKCIVYTTVKHRTCTAYTATLDVNEGRNIQYKKPNHNISQCNAGSASHIASLNNHMIQREPNTSCLAVHIAL